uniref:Uncharacterized protein n=1 Tax=Astatotilapia calliptera TaxID=8154 RepID=A0A3P8R093_ASTCA
MPQQVNQKPRGTDPGHHHWRLDLVGLGETLDRLQDDGEAQRREKDGIDQSPHHLRSDPAEGVLVGRLGFFRHPTDHHFHDEKPKTLKKSAGLRKPKKSPRHPLVGFPV